MTKLKGVTVFCVYMYGEEWETADFHCWMLFHDLYIQYIAKALQKGRKFTRVFLFGRWNTDTA